VIIGGPSWQHIYSVKILDLIKITSKKTIHKIRYLGYLNMEQIIPWYQKASILVRPDTNAISGGNTALEAMACETPVIGTGNHIIKDGVNGIIIPPNNAFELAKSIEFLINNKNYKQKLSKESRKIVIKNFSFEVITEKIIKVYKEMLETL
jgi:phosphatidylinositol alpha-mannosyltransferase